MDTLKLLDRIDFNEQRIRDTIKDLNEIRHLINELRLSPINVDAKTEILMMFNMDYRIYKAISIANTIKEAAKLLNMSERNMYRQIKKYFPYSYSSEFNGIKKLIIEKYKCKF